MFRVFVSARQKKRIPDLPLRVPSRDNRADARCRLLKRQSGSERPPANDLHRIAVCRHRELKRQHRSLRRYSRVLRIVCCIERVKALEQHGENVSLLAIQRNRLALDRGANLSVLGKVSATVGMVRVLDQVRCDLASDLKVHFRRPLAISWNLRRCENSRAVSKVRKVDKQAAVAAENDL